MEVVARAEAKKVTVVRDGGTGERLDYIGSPGIIDENPQAFLVDRLYQDARIDPHFHDIDQFQIVVEGACQMGKQQALPVTIQYADAFTPYGPIVGENSGFAFFTLRPIASGGFFAMPGNKHNMPGRAGRNLAGHFNLDTPPLEANMVKHETLIDEWDGVQVSAIRLGPDSQTDGLPSNAGGQYYLVCSGEIIHDEKRLEKHSLIYVGPGESSPKIVSRLGAKILVTQFSRPSKRPGSDPKLLKSRDPSAYTQRPEGSGR